MPTARSRVCPHDLAGALQSFRDGPDDLLRRFAGLKRVSATVVRLATEEAGQRLRQQQRQGRVVVPLRPRERDFAIQGHSHTAAFPGLDAFSVPVQLSGGGKAEQHRMTYTATLYTPSKSRAHYLVDFDPGQIAQQMREAAKALGLGQADQMIAISDGGNGLEEALRRHFRDDMTCILDWCHASRHLHEYAKALHPRDDAPRPGRAGRAKGILYERGGEALLSHLRGQPAPSDPAVADEPRELIGYFAANEHRRGQRGGAAGDRPNPRRGRVGRPVRGHRVQGPRPRPPPRRQGLREKARPKKVGYGASGVTCPDCERSAGYHSDHRRTLSTTPPATWRGWPGRCTPTTRRRRPARPSGGAGC
jgi:hypothetical protein